MQEIEMPLIAPPQALDSNVVPMVPVTPVAPNAPAAPLPEAFTPDVPPLVAAGEKPLRQLSMAGEANAPDTFEAVINLDGLTVNADLLTDEEMDAFDEEEKRIATLETNGALQARRAYYKTLISKKLKGFNGLKLKSSDKLRNIAAESRFVVLLLQKSKSGFSETDF